MKLGICYPFELEPKTALELVRSCDARGLDSVWIPENPGWPGAFSTAGAVAAVTSRLSVSIGVISAFTRSATIMAVEAGQLQKLSGGRFRLGIGVGSSKVLENLGIDTDHPVEGVADTIAVLRPLLAGGVEQHQGPRHTVRNFKLTFTFEPPPIHIGTVGPKMTALAGRAADGVIITTHAPRALMIQTIDTARAAAQAAGRKPSDIHVTAFLIACIRKDNAEAKNVLRPRLAIDIARMASHVPAMAQLFRSAGLSQEKIDALCAAERPREAAHLLDDGFIDALCFAGDAAAFQRRLEELQAIGVDEVVLFQAAENPDFTEHLDDLVAATANVRRGKDDAR